MNIRNCHITPFLGLLLTVCLILSFSKPKITQKQAIKQAEDFVRRNGYTGQPVDSSKYTLTYEPSERTLDVRTLFSARKNSLHDKACYILHTSEGWQVGFLSTIVDPQELDANALKTDLPGRCVIVPDDGKEIRMDSKEPQFSRFKKL